MSFIFLLSANSLHKPWLFFHNNNTIHHELEKAVAPHSSTLAWKIPWTEEPGGLQSMGSLRVGHDWATLLSLSLSCIGEGNGNPLQCSCLENPRDGGAWWASIYGVAQSRTLLKRLSSSSSYHECLVQWFSKCGQGSWRSLRHLHWVHEVKSIFVILKCHLPFSLCWHLHWRCKSNGGENCYCLTKNQGTGTKLNPLPSYTVKK